jgi:hypothetical protein
MDQRGVGEVYFATNGEVVAHVSVADNEVMAAAEAGGDAFDGYCE